MVENYTWSISEVFCLLSWNTVMPSGASEVSEMTCPIKSGPDCCAFFFFWLHVIFLFKRFCYCCCAWSFAVRLFTVSLLTVSMLHCPFLSILPSLLSIWAKRRAPSNLSLRKVVLTGQCLARTAGSQNYLTDIFKFLASALFLTESSMFPWVCVMSELGLDVKEEEASTLKSAPCDFDSTLLPPP